MIEPKGPILLGNSARPILLKVLPLCLLNPVTAVYGIEVHGLNITKIGEPLYSYSPNDSPKRVDYIYIDEILKDLFYNRMVWSHNVTVSFIESDISNPESGSELTNTDLESIGIEEGVVTENQKASSNKIFSFTLNNLPNRNDSRKENLLRDNEIDTDKNKFTDYLCKKLAKDALQIANAHPNAITRSATTCLCVVLRDKDGHAKKFVFHNGKDKMSDTMEQKAQALKYAIRTGYQAHAEAEFIQFLLQRNEQNPERYTHILGMGCSRQHCKECDCLLQLFLGSNYHKFTAAMCVEDPALPKFTDVEDRCCICARTYHNPLHKSEAVNKGGRRSGKYYLPKLLQEYIQNKVGLNIDFSSNRFTLKDEDTMVNRRNRK